MDVMVRRIFLDQREPARLRAGRVPEIPLRLRPIEVGHAEFSQTYLRVGRPWNWSCLWWPPERWEAMAADPALRGFIVTAGPADHEESAGIVCLRVMPGGETEVLAFGLVPEWVGRGIGGHALTLGLRTAWSQAGPQGEPTRRVWLHTSTNDHPNALQNYLARGLVPFYECDHVRTVPDEAAAHGTS